MAAGGFFVVVCSSSVSSGFCPPPAEGDVVFNKNLLRSPYIHLAMFRKMYGHTITSAVYSMHAVHSM